MQAGQKFRRRSGGRLPLRGDLFDTNERSLTQKGEVANLTLEYVKKVGGNFHLFRIVGGNRENLPDRAVFILLDQSGTDCLETV